MLRRTQDNTASQLESISNSSAAVRSAATSGHPEPIDRPLQPLEM
jgi:hypothetical protein